MQEVPTVFNSDMLYFNPFGVVKQLNVWPFCTRCTGPTGASPLWPEAAITDLNQPFHLQCLALYFPPPSNILSIIRPDIFGQTFPAEYIAGYIRTDISGRLSMDIHGCGPCPATNEHPRRAMDTILSQIEALGEIFNSR